MNDLVWWQQGLIWLLVALVLGAAYVQVFRGGVVNFVRTKLLGKPPKAKQTTGTQRTEAERRKNRSRR